MAKELKFIVLGYRRKQCCGSGIFIPGTSFFNPGSRVKKISDPGSGSASKNLSIFNPKIAKFSEEGMIWDVHPGSGS